MPDQLWSRAQADLCVCLPGQPADPLVWEHSSRVAGLARAMLSLPELSGATVDPLTLTAAALYHDASWVLQVRAGKVHAREMLLRPCTDLQREESADWMMARLGDVLPPGPLEEAARAIRHMNNRRSELLAAEMLAEADNLDQIGPQAVWLMLRKQSAEGRSLADMLATWQRQEEYHYWEARIKESFRFPCVRALAEARLGRLRRFMGELRAADSMEDLTAALAGQQPSGKSGPAPAKSRRR